MSTPDLSRDDIFDIIQRCREGFVQDLQNDVFDYLYEMQLLTNDEYQHLIEHKKRENRIKALLELILKKGNSLFKPFINFVNIHYNWLLKLYLKNEKSSFDIYPDSNSVRQVLLQGGVPATPQRNVSRKDLVELRSRLFSLKRGQFLVVFGMRGCGKSSLVADALTDSPLVFGAFKGVVHWLNVSREISADEFALQSELFSRFSEQGGGVGDARVLPVTGEVPPYDVVSPTRYLQTLMKNPEHKEFLLVLDDVTSNTVVKAFEKIGCKVVITTHDLGVMNDIQNYDKYLIDCSFTEEETLQYFRNCLESDSLPKQASTLHDICKGFPMTISLLGSQMHQHKEGAISNTDRWDYYIRKLRTGGIRHAIGAYDRTSSNQLDYLESAIKMCIDDLQDNLKSHFQDFALFLNDVNINPKVLSILWDIDIKEVEDIMNEFERKSLVVRMWNRALDTYVYSIHDLILDYLKKQLSFEASKRLHLKLIDRYRSRYGSDFVRFPTDDNYMLLYLAYHLERAGLHDLFPKLYLNLIFIEKKLRANGPTDVLLDYKKYKEYIASQPNEDKCEEFEWFVNWAGTRLYQSRICDIVQFALQETKSSCVYKQARELIHQLDQSGHRRFYFEFLTEPPKELRAPSWYHSREEIVTAILTPFDNDKVLIANNAGDIKLINIKTNNTEATYKGHKGRVTCLSLSPNGVYFLSGSDDSTVRIWSLLSIASGEPNYAEKPRTPSPSFKQEHWMDGFVSSRSSGEKQEAILNEHNKAIVDAQYSNNGRWIVTAALDKTARIWTMRAHEVLGKPVLLRLNDDPVNCCFNLDDTLIVCAFRNYVTMYSITGNEFAKVPLQCQIKSLSIVNSIAEPCKMLLMGKDFITVCEITSADSGNKSTLSNGKSYMHSPLLGDDYDNICATVSHDGKCVAVAASNYCTIIYNVDDGKILAKFHEINGLTRSLSWSRRNLMLLAAYDNKRLKLWNVEHNSSLRNTIKLRHYMFDAIWTSPNSTTDEDNRDDVFDEEYFLAAIVTNRNTIQVYYNDICKLSIEVKGTNNSSEVIAVAVSAFEPDIINVVYVCSDGSLHRAIIEDECLQHHDTLHRIENFYNSWCYCKLKIHATVDDKKAPVLRVFLSYFSSVESRSFLYVFHLYYSGQNLNEMTNSEHTKDIIPIEKRKLVNFYVLSNHIVLILDNHSIRTYDLVNKRTKLEGRNSNLRVSEVLSCDLSYDGSWACTISNLECVMYNRQNGNRTFIDNHDSEQKPTVCTFSKCGNYVAIGYDDGAVSIIPMNKSDFSIVSRTSTKLAESAIMNIIWSPTDEERLLVMSKREIILTDRTNLSIISVVYLFVDKIVPSQLFKKFFTISCNGHLHILKHPL